MLTPAGLYCEQYKVSRGQLREFVTAICRRAGQFGKGCSLLRGKTGCGSAMPHPGSRGSGNLHCHRLAVDMAHDWLVMTFSVLDRLATVIARVPSMVGE